MTALILRALRKRGALGFIVGARRTQSPLIDPGGDIRVSARVGTRPKICGPLLLALLLLQASCTRVPPLRPYDERTSNGWPAAPLAVVGVAEGDALIGHPVPAEPPLQLHRVTVHVENLLRGTIPEHTITVYYFALANLNFGTRILIFHQEPVRRVLWLRKDGGVYRTACDWQNCTVRIESGAHPGYRPDPNASMDQTLTDLSLTRGEGPVDDYRFAQEMRYIVGRAGLDGYTIEKLRHLALTESSEVKYAACEGLWGYTEGEPDKRLSERARDSVAAAGCTCGITGSGLACH